MIKIGGMIRTENIIKDATIVVFDGVDLNIGL